jgi:two-component system cell cycle sensor histidine kinase/response regulator CckA
VSTSMNQAGTPVSKTTESQSRSTRIHLHQIERRQWWLSASAIVVTLLLTLGAASLASSMFYAQGGIFYLLDLRQAVSGLLGLVLLFDVYVIYQQLQIHRIRLQLNEQQELFRLISENAADMIAVVDTNGRRLYNSPSYQKILGYSPEELEGTPSLEQIHPDDRQFVSEAGQQARRTGMGRKLEYRFRHKDGTWRILESSASVIRNAKGEPEKFVIVNRDITERKQAEKTLRENRLRQVHKMEAVGRLSGGIAHDFNNLLGVIIGYSEVLEGYLGESDPIRKSVEEIKKAGQRAASLTRQLLAFSRQQVLEPKVLDLNAFVPDVEKMLRRLIGEDIELTTVLDPALGRVKADQGQIEQVIMNLAANARDAMPEGGKLTIETGNVEVDESFVLHSPYVRPGPYVQLVVSDTGVGMDAEMQGHIFEPFFTTKGLGRGTGLGLATVYGIVKQSNGYIWVDSEVGKGATFKIYLPRVEDAVETASPEAPQSQTWHGWETILLVEDEESLRSIIRDLLTQSGYDVLEANSGAHALEIAERHQGPIHLLLTDVVMPGMSGPILAEKLAASRPETRMLYMSGYTDYPTGQQSILDSSIPLLDKPFTRDRLIRKVRAALEPKEVTSRA